MLVFAEHALKLSTMAPLNAASMTDHSGVVARPRADMDGVLTLLQTSKGDKKRQERWLTVVEPLGRHECDRYVLVEVDRIVVRRLLIAAGEAHQLPRTAKQKLFPSQCSEDNFETRIRGACRMNDLLRIHAA